MKFAATALAGTFVGASGQKPGPDTVIQKEYIILEEHEINNLRNADLGEFIGVHQAHKEFKARWGVDLFPALTKMLSDVASGSISADAEQLKKFNSGWTKERKPFEMLQTAKDKLESTNISGPEGYEERIKPLLQRVLSVAPGLFLTLPKEIEYRSEGPAAGDKLFLADVESTADIPGFYYSTIHELGHIWERAFEDENGLWMLKQFIPKDAIANYPETYIRALDAVLGWWTDLDFEDSLVVKNGNELASITGYDDLEIKNGYKEAVYYLADRLNINIIEDLEDIKNAGKEIDSNNLFLWWNVASYHHFKLLNESFETDFEKYQELINDKQLSELRERFVGELYHILTGPIYGPATSDTVTDVQLNLLYQQAETLETVRLQTQSADGKLVPFEEIKRRLYQDIDKDKRPENILVETPKLWPEEEAMFNFGVKALGRVLINYPDGRVEEVRAYELPRNPFLSKEKRLIQLKSYIPDPDSSGSAPGLVNLSQLIILDENAKSVSEESDLSNPLVLNFAEDLNVKADYRFSEDSRKVVLGDHLLVNDRAVVPVENFDIFYASEEYVGSLADLRLDTHILLNSELKPFLLSEQPSIVYGNTSSQTRSVPIPLGTDTNNAVESEFGVLKLGDITVVKGVGEPYSVFNVGEAIDITFKETEAGSQTIQFEGLGSMFGNIIETSYTLELEPEIYENWLANTGIDPIPLGFTGLDTRYLLHSYPVGNSGSLHKNHNDLEDKGEMIQVTVNLYSPEEYLEFMRMNLPAKLIGIEIKK